MFNTNQITKERLKELQRVFNWYIFCPLYFHRIHTALYLLCDYMV